MDFERMRVGVIGGSNGLGSWVVRFFKENGFWVRFTSSDAHTQFVSNTELVQEVDIVILAVPITAMLDTLSEIYPHLSGKILIEVCSVKKFIFERYAALKTLHPQVELAFYSIHPMFSQRIRSLTGQVIIFTGMEEKEAAFTLKIKELFVSNGAALYEMEHQEHDRMMGLVQGLNHFSVFVSAKTLQKFNAPLEEVKNFSSPAYRIFVIFFTRYVLQNPRLYADIQMYNEYVIEVVKLFRSEVDTLLGLIESKNRGGFIEYVEQMQPYFASNHTDEELSNHLIHQLGWFLNEKTKSN